MTKLISPAPLGSPGIPFGYAKSPYSPWNTHRGDDWKWKWSSPETSRKVVASAAGTVNIVYSGDQNNNGYGRRIVIQHPSTNGSTILTTYNHLAAGSIKVRIGQKVKAGQHLATMGNSGDTGGTIHLHRELWINGDRVNARIYHSKDIPGTAPTGATRAVSAYISGLNGREKPTTKSPIEGAGLKPGKRYRFYYWTRGQKVTITRNDKKKTKVTSDIWVQGKTGRWYAAAGLTSRSTAGLIKK